MHLRLTLDNSVSLKLSIYSCEVGEEIAGMTSEISSSSRVLVLGLDSGECHKLDLAPVVCLKHY